MHKIGDIKRISLVIVAAIVCLLASFFPATMVAADTTQPHEFYGDITINGVAAPVGRVLAAKIGGIERGSFTTTEVGEYGGSGTFDPRLVVAGEEVEVGEEITFWVNGVRANQTAIYNPGQSTELDISAQKYPLNAGDIQITKALSYLRQAQQPNGSIGGFHTSAWVVMAIAAAGQDPDTWTAGGDSIVAYLRDNANVNLDPNKATDWEKAILAIVAAGDNPRDFGGIDYVDTLLGLYDGNQMGSASMLNDDFWGILALSAMGESQQTIQSMKSFIVNNQNGDGGWGWIVGGASDADNTAAAISALIAAGESPGSQTITNALAYLKSQQQNNGGFISQGATNSACNSWVINAITDAGQSPIADEWRQGSNNPIGHLLSLQDIDGAFKWAATTKSNPEWMTAYATIALLGGSWPEDATPPSILNLWPLPGTVRGITTRISADYSDTSSGIDESTARIQLDGTDVTSSATVTASSIRYDAEGLALGNHLVRVTVSDKSGNGASQSWSFQSSTGGGGGGGDSGGDGEESSGEEDGGTIASLPVGTTDVSDIVGNDGAFTATATARSGDGNCTLTIDKDTKGVTEGGAPLGQITITKMENPPSPPTGANVIGLSYDFGPDGATFDPPITLSFTYDLSDVPEGVSEENLVIAMWNVDTGEWIILDCTCDPDTNTITASAGHFTVFAILSLAHPPAFAVSDLSITPGEVSAGEEVVISVLVANTGDLTGNYEVTLKINSLVVETQQVTITSDVSEQVSFIISEDTAGTYDVNVNGLTCTFVVQEIPPPAPSATASPPAGAVNWTVLWIVIAVVTTVIVLVSLKFKKVI